MTDQAGGWRQAPEGQPQYQHAPWHGGPQYPPPPPPYVPPTQGWPNQQVAVDNTFAWTLAFAPLLLVLVDGLLIAAGIAGVGPAWLAAIALNIALAMADHRRVRATGINIPAALAALLVPVYLFQRQSRLRQNYAIPIVWCVTFLVSLGGAGIIGSTVGVPLDTNAVQKQIAQDVQAQTGEAVTVRCPSSATVRTGASFQCVVKAADGSTAIATVTVQNSQGEFIWHIGP